MELWLATGNKGKTKEFKKLLSPFSFEVHSQDELGFFSPPPEDGDSFEANARIKARALKAIKPEAWVIADDSGLVVEGLGGLPGIHSARYAGPRARDSENNAKLLQMMRLRTPTQREAYFYCCLVILSSTGQEFCCQGKLEGNIAHKLSGKEGFGYDPLFIPLGEIRTLGEMSFAQKNAISHRSKALKAFLEILNKNFPSEKVSSKQNQ